MRKKGLEPPETKKAVFSDCIQNLGSLMVLINSRFLVDLKRLADVKRKMDEFDELGKRIKLANSRPRK